MQRYYAILFLIPLAFSACVYDSNLGRVNCIEVNYSNQWQINIQATMKNMRMIENGYIPTMKGWEKANREGVHSPTHIEMPVNKTPSTTPAPKLVANVTNKSNPTQKIVPCQNERERDWMAYCQSLYLEMGIDCFNTNKQAKDEIMRNMASIKGCVYVK